MIKLSHIAKSLLLESKIRPGVDFVFKENPELSEIGTPEQYSEYLDTIFPSSKIKDIVYHGTSGTWYKTDKFKHNVGIKTTYNQTRKFGHWFASSPKVTELFNTIDLEDLTRSFHEIGNNQAMKDRLIDQLQKEYNLTDEEVYELADVWGEYVRQKALSWGTPKYTPPKVSRYTPRSSKTVTAIINAQNPVYGDTEFFAGSTRRDGLNALEYLDSLKSDIIILPQLQPGQDGLGADEWEHGTHYAVKNADDIHILGSKQDIEGFKKFVENL